MPERRPGHVEGRRRQAVVGALVAARAEHLGHVGRGPVVAGLVLLVGWIWIPIWIWIDWTVGVFDFRAHLFAR